MARRKPAGDGNLLVVDWDCFFRNPLEAGDITPADSDVLLLYDWGHQESKLFIDMLWPMRAAAFVNNGLALPQVNERWQTFAQRFAYADGCTLSVADSNAYAGTIHPHADVWLYDAHHDCYKLGRNVHEWSRKATNQETGMLEFSCENWMGVHYACHNARLHHRFPDFRMDRKTGLGVDYGALPPKPFHLDGKLDLIENDPIAPIDHVFVCRSGAWVPPWCDEKFMTFVHSFGLDVEQMDDVPLVRTFTFEMVEAEVRERAEAFARFNAREQQSA